MNFRVVWETSESKVDVLTTLGINDKIPTNVREVRISPQRHLLPRCCVSSLARFLIRFEISSAFSVVSIGFGLNHQKFNSETN